MPEEDRPAFQLSLETGLSVDRLDDLREHLEIDPPEPDPADSSADQQFDENTSLLGALSGNAVPATTS